MSGLERMAIDRVVSTALALGLDVPAEVTQAAARLDCHDPSGGALAWVRAHPEYLGDHAPITGCCDGEVYRGADACYCWVPEFDLDQAVPRPDPDASTPTGVMCHDCAYRPKSPERQAAHLSDSLMALPATGAPFWCHQGMRRPVRWRHPDGRVVDGDPDDYQPPMVAGVPYQANGDPGRLCSGWTALRLAAVAEQAAAGSAPAG